MNKTEFQQLITSYLNGSATERERKLVEDFYEEIQNSEEGWGDFSDAEKRNLKGDIFEQINVAKSRKVEPKAHDFGWLKIAASVIILIGAGLIYLNFFSGSGSEEWITQTSVPGQQLVVNLSDGSVVKLNNSSSVSYPKEFKDDLREVKMKGEAYFDVVKDPDRPFEVLSYSLKTTVLGTTFNINAFDSTEIDVALLTGKVKVNNIAETSSGVLNPGQMAIYDASLKKVSVADFDNEKVLAWQDKILYFQDATYKEVFDELGRWYGVTFKFANKPADEWSFSGKFKNKSLSIVLETIGFSEGFEFEINDKVVDIKFNAS
ncbi:MAG: FecR domain-containing protein [Bacteroidota bacterium]